MTTEHVQRMLEDMIPELNDYRNRKLFTNDEIKSITKKRTAFEFQLIRRAPILADYLRFLQYEMNLDLLRRKRKLRMNQVKRTNTVSDYAIVKRIHVLFERSVRKFSNDVNLWMQFIDWSIACGSVKRLTRIFPRALQVHPLVPALWIKAAKHDFEVTGNIDSARVYFQRGLRFNPTSKELWLAFFRMEMRFIGRLIARKAALGLIPTRGLLDKVLQKEAKRQSKRDGEEGKDGNDDDDEDQIAFSKIKVPDSVAVLANRLDASDRAVLSGALPAAIFRNAILTPALARDVEFRLEFLPFISEWQRATEAEHLSKSVARTGGNLNAIKLVSTMATASPDVQARPDRVVDIECLRVAGVRIANVFDAVLFSLARDFPVTPDCVDARARATLVDSDYVDPSSIASTPQDFSSSSSSSAAGAAAGGKKSKKSRIESVIKSASSSSSSSSSSQPSLADSLAGLPEMSAIRVYESAITRASTSTRTSNASKSTAAAIHTLMLKFLHERLTEHSGVAARCFTLYESIQTRRFAPTVTSSSSSSSTSTSSSSSTSTTSSSSSVDVFSTSTSSVTAADLHTADEALAQAAASTRASSALRQTFLAGCLSAHVRHVATLATYRLWIQTLRQSGAVLPTGHVAMGDVAIDKVSDDLFDRSAGGASLVADDDDDEDEDDDDGINNNGAGDMHQVEGRWTKKSSSSSSSSSHGDMVSTDVNVALRAVIAAAIKASTKVRAHAQSAQNAHAGVANGGSADAATAAADAEDEFKTSQVSDLFPLWMEIIDIHRAGYASALAQSLLLHSTKQQQQHQHQQQHLQQQHLQHQHQQQHQQQQHQQQHLQHQHEGHSSTSPKLSEKLAWSRLLEAHSAALLRVPILSAPIIFDALVDLLSVHGMSAARVRDPSGPDAVFRRAIRFFAAAQPSLSRAAVLSDVVAPPSAQLKQLEAVHNAREEAENALENVKDKYVKWARQVVASMPSSTEAEASACSHLLRGVVDVITSTAGTTLSTYLACFALEADIRRLDRLAGVLAPSSSISSSISSSFSSSSSSSFSSMSKGADAKSSTAAAIASSRSRSRILLERAAPIYGHSSPSLWLAYLECIKPSKAIPAFALSAAEAHDLAQNASKTTPSSSSSSSSTSSYASSAVTTALASASLAAAVASEKIDFEEVAMVHKRALRTLKPEARAAFVQGYDKLMQG